MPKNIEVVLPLQVVPEGKVKRNDYYPDTMPLEGYGEDNGVVAIKIETGNGAAFYPLVFFPSGTTFYGKYSYLWSWGRWLWGIDLSGEKAVAWGEVLTSWKIRQQVCRECPRAGECNFLLVAGIKDGQWRPGTMLDGADEPFSFSALEQLGCLLVGGPVEVQFRDTDVVLPDSFEGNEENHGAGPFSFFKNLLKRGEGNQR